MKHGNPIRYVLFKFLITEFWITSFHPNFASNLLAIQAIQITVPGHTTMIYGAFLIIRTMKNLAPAFITANAHICLSAIAF